MIEVTFLYLLIDFIALMLNLYENGCALLTRFRESEVKQYVSNGNLAVFNVNAYLNFKKSLEKVLKKV